MQQEKTVVLIKPDAVARGLIGEIVTRFEKVGLRIIAVKMVWVDENLVGQHYQDDEEYHLSVGKKSLEDHRRNDLDPRETVGTDDPLDIGRKIRKYNMEFLSSGPIVALLLSGFNAIEVVRKIVGSTFPHLSPPGTIRGDYASDSPILANLRKRTTKNLVHASGSRQEATYEGQLWFTEEEVYEYQRSDEAVMF